MQRHGTSGDGSANAPLGLPHLPRHTLFAGSHSVQSKCIHVQYCTEETRKSGLGHQLDPARPGHYRHASQRLRLMHVESQPYFSVAFSRTGRKGPYAHYYVQIAPDESFVGEWTCPHIP